MFLPDRAVADKSVPDDALRVLAALFMHAGEDGRFAGGSARLAKLSGMGAVKAAEAVRSLVMSGWVDMEHEGRKEAWLPRMWKKAVDGDPYLAQPKERRPLFHRENMAVSADDIKAMISEFVGSGLSATAKNPYAMPWMRKGAERLLRERGFKRSTTMIADLAARKDDPWRVQTKSLWELAEKWDRCSEFLAKKQTGKPKIVSI